MPARSEGSSELLDVGPDASLQAASPGKAARELLGIHPSKGSRSGIALVSWRPPDRSSWSRLGRSSRRVREAEMELRWIAPAPDLSQRMAVRLRRKNGPAPLRNRIRRILRELHREHALALGEVWMLWTFVPGRLRTPTRDLRATAARLLTKAGLLPATMP